MRKLILVGLVLQLQACALVGPDYLAPQTAVDLDQTFIGQQQVMTEQVLYKAVEPEVNWWKQLNDDALNHLIALSLQQNTDLRIAMANLASSRAVLVESETGLQPTIDAEGSVERQRLPGYQTGSNNDSADDETVTSVGLGLGWELDLFGQVRRAIEAATANIAVQEALLADVQRLVIADVAAAYIDYRGAQERQKVIERNITNQRKTLELTQSMASEGASSDLDVARARAQLTLTLSLLPTVKNDTEAARNRLATLTSQDIRQVEQQLSTEHTLLTLPNVIAVGEPAGLIRRRPDIKAAERKLAQATAQVGVNTADLFPKVSLNGNIGFAADTFSELDASGAFNYGIGPAISWNVFNRDAIKARIQQAEANVDMQLAEYDRTVLNALEEINSYLAEHGYERQRRQALQTSVEASAESVELVQARYREGVESFLAVLDAERTLLTSEQELTNSNIALNQSLIMIYRALGGSWQ